MTKNIKFVGLDVHAATVAIAVAEMGGEVRSLGVVKHELGAIRRVLGKLGKKEQLRVCYEAGPTGYALYWEFTRLGIECIVVAPSLIPKAASDRVKTDRRDAQKLARCHRAGDLTSVWVPDQEHEALRDLVRLREAAQEDHVRAKHRLGKFFLRYGLKDPSGKKKWSDIWWQWARKVTMPYVEQEVTLVELMSEVDHQKHRLIRLEAAIDRAIAEAPVRLQKIVEGLQSLRGVAKLSAVTLAIELGSMTRFQKASQVMSYTGLTSSEYSSGGKRRQGAITKAGNAHLRRVLVEAAWQYRHPPRLMQRQKRWWERGPLPSRMRLGERSNGFTAATGHCHSEECPWARSSLRSPVNSRASSGPSACVSKTNCRTPRRRKNQRETLKRRSQRRTQQRRETWKGVMWF